MKVSINPGAEEGECVTDNNSEKHESNKSPNGPIKMQVNIIRECKNKRWIRSYLKEVKVFTDLTSCWLF